MAEVGSAFVSILPSAKGFGKNLTKQVEPETKKAGGSIGKSLVKGMAIAGGGAAAFGFLKNAVGDASDLSEAGSKVGVVFGKQAGQIMAASRTSATAMGLTRGAYLEATGTLGNLLVSLDIAPKKAAGLSQEMVKLAGDMASFNNTSPEEALDALRSGLTGETEPLKRFGVNMNDATLKAQALKMGLIKSTKQALNPQTKALAASALIMKQTKTAQGDFARTSGGLANQQRILAAQFGNVRTSIGQALLPAITDLATIANDKVVPAVSKFIGEMKSGEGAGGDFADTLDSVGDAGKAAFSALKPLVNLAGNAVGVFGGLPGPIKTLAAEAAIAAIVFPRLSRGIAGMGGSFTNPIARIKQFSAEMSYAETRAAHVNRIVGGLKNGAGIAGMVALADGARRSSGALKELETIGGAALTGFALGGPIGGAVAGGGTLLFRLARAGGEAGRKIEAAKPGIGSIVGTLDEVTGAATRATRALVFNSIQKQGGFQLLNQAKAGYAGLAITQRDLVDAAMGNAAAQKRVASALGQAVTQTKKAAAGDSSKYKSTQDLMKATNGLNKILGTDAKQLDKAATKTRALHRATAPAAQLLKEDLTKGAKNSARTIKDLSSASQRSSKSVNGLGNAVKKVPTKRNIDLNVNTHDGEGKVRRLRDEINNLQDRTIHILTVTNKPKVLPGNATGTNDWRGGPTWVGERGPEIVNLPRHSQVIPNHKIGTSGGPSSGDRWEMVLDDGTRLGGYVRRQASGVVAGHAGVNRERARSRR